MIPATQRWDKIIEELQKKTKIKNSKSGTMCKDKWNVLNFNYKKLANYHKGTRNHTIFLELSFEKKERFHLPLHFNQKCYNAIEAFQGEKVINVPFHMRNVNVKGNGVYRPLVEEIQDENDDFQSQNNVPNSPDRSVNIQVSGRAKGFVNLCEESTKLFIESNQLALVINLNDRHTTLATCNTKIKRKRNNFFSPIIESINKNSKTLFKQWTRPTFYNFKLKSTTQKCKTTTSKNN
jgi:hypothetical protein